MIAGHRFSLEGQCSCGKRFGDISGVLREDIGKREIAHTDHLTENEYNQIVAERERIWLLVISSSMDSPPAPAPPIHDDANFDVILA